MQQKNWQSSNKKKTNIFNKNKTADIHQEM